MSKHVGNYKDLNGDTVRVTFENRRYYYEVTDGTPDRYVSHQGPDSDRTLAPDGRWPASRPIPVHLRPGIFAAGLCE